MSAFLPLPARNRGAPVPRAARNRGAPVPLPACNRGAPVPRLARNAALAAGISVCLLASTPPAAFAVNPLKPVCGVAGWVSGIAGKACGVIQHGGKLLKAGKKLATGHLGGAAKTLLTSGGASSSGASMAVGLAAVGAWVLGGARAALHGTATVIEKTTSPRLGTTWFSSTYWRMTGLAAVLTLPFLFAAAVQGLIRSDLALLVRAALGYLPLAMLAVSIAAPLTMLLLAVSDEMSAVVSSAAGGAGARFLQETGLIVGGLSFLARSPFLAFLVGLLTAAGAIVLWVELLIRQAAIYVVVLMLPLAFAALVWPARRVWAVRSVELLVALILSKFAIVAVLALAGAALNGTGVGGMLTGMVLVVLAAFAPWALLRLLPLAELASGAAGTLRGEATRWRGSRDGADTAAGVVSDWAGSLAAGMRRQAEHTHASAGHANGTGVEIAKLADVPSNGNGTSTNRGDPGEPGAGEAASASGADLAEDGDGAVAAEEADLTASAQSPAASEERLPGMDPIWQAPDFGWQTLVLGPGEGWPPKPLWPSGDGTSAESGDGGPDLPGGHPRELPSAGDDPDPTPPKQAPPDGRL